MSEAKNGQLYEAQLSEADMVVDQECLRRANNGATGATELRGTGRTWEACEATGAEDKDELVGHRRVFGGFIMLYAWFSWSITRTPATDLGSIV